MSTQSASSFMNMQSFNELESSSPKDCQQTRGLKKSKRVYDFNTFKTTKPSYNMKVSYNSESSDEDSIQKQNFSNNVSRLSVEMIFVMEETTPNYSSVKPMAISYES